MPLYVRETLPVGTTFKPFSPGVILTPSGVAGPYTWTIAAGALPPGVGFSGGIYTGSPTLAGSYNWEVKCVSGANWVVLRYDITVSDPPILWDSSRNWTETTRGAALGTLGTPLFAEEFGSTTLALVNGHSAYGAGAFDAYPGAAYVVAGGELELKMYKVGSAWRSGNLQTADNAGVGFMAVDCYWEARIKVPGISPVPTDRNLMLKTPGMWPAFWMLSPNDAASKHTEVDCVELYCNDPRGHHQGAHLWTGGGDSSKNNYTGMDLVTDGQYHTYGVITKRNGEVITYIDRTEISRFTFPYVLPPMYALLSLAVYAPEASIANPGSIFCDYLRCYPLPT
jgi:hypothetical protein